MFSRPQGRWLRPALLDGGRATWALGVGSWTGSAGYILP